MCEFDFAKRLTQLRSSMNVSAREMSLDIGQNPSYINNIENGKMLPSITTFYFICEYLKISPKDFFDDKCLAPNMITPIVDNLRKLKPEQLQHISLIIEDLVNTK